MEELDTGRIFLRNTDTSDAKFHGIVDEKDLVRITYGSLELECDEEADAIKCEPFVSSFFENEAEVMEVKVTEDARENDYLKGMEFDNKEYFDGSLKGECDDETKFSEEMSVVNIVPIFDQELRSDTDDCNGCQVVCHTGGRATSNKRIKLEFVDRDDGHLSVQNVTCSTDTGIDKPSKSHPPRSSSANEKPLDMPKQKSVCAVCVPFTNSSQLAELNHPKCAKCKTMFLTVQALDNHMKKKHSLGVLSELPSWRNLLCVPEKTDLPGSMKCPVCDVKFPGSLSSSEEIEEHLKIHLPKLYACRSCGQGFTRKDNHERHLAFHEDQKVHCCHICEKHFKLSDNFVAKFVNVGIHMHTHRITQVAGKHPVPEFLSNHVRINLNNLEPYCCSICGRAFTRLARLLTHVASHSDECRYSCTICAKECLSGEDVNMCMCKSYQATKLTSDNREVKTLMPQKVRCKYIGKFYNCIMCNQGFTQQENAKKHLLSSHSKRKYGYSCRICNDVTDSDANMKTHMELHKVSFGDGLSASFKDQIKKQGENFGLFVCNLCGFSNARVQALVSHLSGHLKRSCACPECGKEYLTQDEVRKHEILHAVRMNCWVCNKQFLSGEDLKRHHERHFGSLSTCTFCEQQFLFPENLEKHKKAVHCGKTLHPCHACGASFSLNELKKHINQVHRGCINGIPEGLSSRIMIDKFSVNSVFCSRLCSLCGKGFSNLKDVLRHLLAHSKAKLACNCCGKEFVQYDLLTQHYKTHQTNAKLAKNNQPTKIIDRPFMYSPVFVEHSYCIPPVWSILVKKPGFRS